MKNVTLPPPPDKYFTNTAGRHKDTKTKNKYFSKFVFVISNFGLLLWHKDTKTNF